MLSLLLVVTFFAGCHAAFLLLPLLALAAWRYGFLRVMVWGALADLPLPAWLTIAWIPWGPAEGLARWWPAPVLAAALLLMAALRAGFRLPAGVLPFGGRWSRRFLAAVAVLAALVPGAFSWLLSTYGADAGRLVAVGGVVLVYHAPLYLALAEEPVRPAPPDVGSMD